MKNTVNSFYIHEFVKGSHPQAGFEKNSILPEAGDCKASKNPIV